MCTLYTRSWLILVCYHRCRIILLVSTSQSSCLRHSFLQRTSWLTAGYQPHDGPAWLPSGHGLASHLGEEVEPVVVKYHQTSPRSRTAQEPGQSGVGASADRGSRRQGEGPYRWREGTDCWRAGTVDSERRGVGPPDKVEVP